MRQTCVADGRMCHSLAALRQGGRTNWGWGGRATCGIQVARRQELYDWSRRWRLIL